MSEFDTILENSLKGVSSGFDQAVAELNDLVGSLSQAVQKALHPKRSSLRLEPVREDADSVIFRLELSVWEQDPPHRGNSVGEYRVSHMGYPIYAGSWDPRERSFTYGQEFNNRKSLQQHFKEMLGNPSSPLVAEVAFRRGRRKIKN